MCLSQKEKIITPVCRDCGKIYHADQWKSTHGYIQGQNHIEIPGLCPRCAKKRYPEINIQRDI